MLKAQRSCYLHENSLHESDASGVALDELRGATDEVWIGRVDERRHARLLLLEENMPSRGANLHEHHHSILSSVVSPYSCTARCGLVKSGRVESSRRPPFVSCRVVPFRFVGEHRHTFSEGRSASFQAHRWSSVVTLHSAVTRIENLSELRPEHVGHTLLPTLPHMLQLHFVQFNSTQLDVSISSVRLLRVEVRCCGKCCSKSTVQEYSTAQ